MKSSTALASGAVLLATEALRVKVFVDPRHQYELAEKAGVSRTTFNQIINGVLALDPDSEHVTKICQLMNIPKAEAFRLVK